MPIINEKADIKKIEKGVKNKHNGTWLQQKDNNGEYPPVSEKLIPLGCVCGWCNNILINYGSSGKEVTSSAC